MFTSNPLAAARSLSEGNKEGHLLNEDKKDSTGGLRRERRLQNILWGSGRVLSNLPALCVPHLNKDLRIDTVL